jgi:hypothetical protein
LLFVVLVSHRFEQLTKKFSKHLITNGIKLFSLSFLLPYKLECFFLASISSLV